MQEVLAGLKISKLSLQLVDTANSLVALEVSYVIISS